MSSVRITFKNCLASKQGSIGHDEIFFFIRCTQKDDISEVDETIATPMEKNELIDLVKEVLFSVEYEDRMHNVSACKLPKSRRIMQRRFQN